MYIYIEEVPLLLSLLGNPADDHKATCEYASKDFPEAFNSSVNTLE